MAEHRDDGLIDKVKDALGMGDEDDRTMTDRVGDADAGSGLNAGAWNEGGPSTGFGDAGGTLGGADRGADDDVLSRTEGGIGTSPGFGADGSDSGDRTTLTGGGTSEWTRGEAASGRTPFGGDEDDPEADRDRGI